jgi:hypothetical protein
MFNTKEIIENYLSSTNSNIERIKGVFASLSVSKFNWKPAPEKWSVGECIDHLVVTNDLYLTRIKKLLNICHSNSENDFPYSQSFMGKMISKAVDPANVKKAKTFNLFYPGKRVIQKSVIDEYIKSSKKFIEQVSKIHHLDLKKIKLSSPVNFLIRLNLGDPLIIIPKHDERYLNQAERLMEMEAFPKG